MGFSRDLTLTAVPPRCRLAAAGLLLGLLLPARSAPAERHDPGEWEQATRARDDLQGMASASRTEAEYLHVLDAFRRIYHAHPGDAHAADAVNAVAELLAEQGRQEHRPGLLRAAVKQYEFLRGEYPGSSLRVAALLAEAQIQQNDLRDPGAARERYLTFLDHYPRSSLAEQARAGLESLTPAETETRASAAQAPGSPTAQAMEKQPAPIERRPAITVPSPSGEVYGTADTRNMAENAGTAQVPGPAASPVSASASRRRDHPALVSGIRHWSTLNYTRVAIDLGDEVQYEAARVPSPDRIYFDLHGARLAPDLVGKSFAVTDNGFLKRIRVAESSGNVARIVLDVNDVTEYSAFLLPNPYRLIIDIHGRSKPATPLVVAEADAPARPATAVPNTRAVVAGSSTDVARLSDHPDKVQATTVPTSRPIAAVVRGHDAGVGEAASQGGGTTDHAPQPAPAAGASSSVQNGTESVAAPTTAQQSKTAAAPASLRHSRGKSKVSTADTLVVGDPGTPARVAQKTAGGETSLVRALGLGIHRIVIDAGHGGHDSGTLGTGGIEEKDVVLDVALRVGQLLRERLGAEVIFTRSDDTFVPLETRTAIANKAQADLFLSIHANSSPDASARGVETYYLNFTSQPDALEVAARENAVSGQSISQLSDLVRKITLKDKIAESREFAVDVEQSLYGGLARGNEGLKNRGVKKAPFVVLIGANMPSVLAEISFVTNPRDAAQLRQADYRQRVAESLFRGVARYAGGLSSGAPAVQRAAGQ